MGSQKSVSSSLAATVFRSLAKSYISIKKPKVIAVAGSVGKTSTKLYVSKILASEKNVSYMDDSYNNGIGLYLSVFRKKIPTNLKNIFSWISLLLSVFLQFLQRGPEIIVIEYGIDHIGDMDEFIRFMPPDIALLTAVCPEHMEYFKTIDAVAKEELKIIPAAKQFSVINYVDIDPKYTKNIKSTVYTYGDSKTNASYQINQWTNHGAIVSFKIDDLSIEKLEIKLVSEPLIRQLAGAILLAKLLGISKQSIIESVRLVEPAASRMMLLDGVNNSTVIDDTVNFSPLAGIEALKALKRIPGKRHIAILGNMHELGEYAGKGFKDVSLYFKTEIDVLILVGELSIGEFGPYAADYGFIKDKNLFYFPDSVSAGIYVRDKLVKPGDVILVKGPFGGYYLEETVKKLLKNPSDAKKLTRQSDFWLQKKQIHYGKSFNQ